MLWITAFSLALAQEEPPVIELPSVEPLPSVLEDFDEAEQPLIRTQFGLRPELGLTFITEEQSRFASRLGVTFEHQWWTVKTKGVGWIGSTQLMATGLIGKLKGYEFELSSVAGPWLGPINLRVGPNFRGDRLFDKPTERLLNPAFLIGFRAGFTLDTEYFTLWAHGVPMWGVAGNRQPGPLKGVTEFDLETGLAIRSTVAQLIRLQTGVKVRTRWTAMGPLFDINLVFGFNLGTL